MKTPQRSSPSVSLYASFCHLHREKDRYPEPPPPQADRRQALPRAGMKA